MSTPIFLGVGAISAALIGRTLIRRSAAGAEQWVRGGFKGKMDRSEAIQVLGLKYVFISLLPSFYNLLTNVIETTVP